MIKFEDLKANTFITIDDSIFYIYARDDERIATRSYWVNDLEGGKKYYTKGNITYFEKDTFEAVVQRRKVNLGLSSLTEMLRRKFINCIWSD